MSGWDSVDVGFRDETANFGPRIESGSPLYQIETKATISHSGEVTENPRICGVATEDQLVVAAGSHISSFEDAGHTYLVTQCFEADIEALALTEDGSILVVGDSLGYIHCFDYKTATDLFSKRLVIKDGTNNRQKAFSHMTFTPQSDNGYCDLLVVSFAQVHLLKNINFKQLCEALVKKDMNRAEILQSEVIHKIIDTDSHHTDMVLYGIFGQQSECEIITVGAGKYVICMWEIFDSHYIPVKQIPGSVIGGAAICKCIETQCGNLLCLDTKGILSLINLQLFIVIKQFHCEKIKDISLMEMETQDKENSLTDLKLIMLTSSPDGTTKLEICLLSTMETIYSLVLLPWTFLVQSGSYQDSVFIVEGVSDETSDSELVSSLRVRCVTEAEPEVRLSRLINKGYLEEAISFAKMFKLDLEFVYKAKANQLINALSPWNVNKLKPEEITDYIQDLHSSLKQIKDNTHVTECCIMAVLPTFQETFQLLMFAKERLAKTSDDGDNKSWKEINGQLLTKVLEILYRLETYQKAYGQEKFSGEYWSEFVQADMLNEMISQLSEYNIVTAAIIWNRHKDEIAKEFSVTVVKEIFDSIPEQMSASQLKPWLADDFLPFVVQKLPDALPLVVNWIEQKARRMEIDERESWPANALEFCELLHNKHLVISQLESDGELSSPEELAIQTCSFPTQCSRINHGEEHNETLIFEDTASVFQSFRLLFYQLEQLLHLHTKFNCKLSLASFVSETTESLAVRLLDSAVAIEFIPSTMENVVCPYLIENKLEKDSVLFQYVKELSTCRESYRVGYCLWEAKAVAVIQFIEDVSYKLHAICEVMRGANIPWSNDVKALVEEGMATNHPKTAEIKDLYLLAELQKVLIKYGLRKCVSKSNETGLQLVHYIIRQDKPSCLEDALCVIDAYRDLAGVEVYVVRIHFLIECNRLEEVMSLLTSLPEKTILECGTRILDYVKVMLDIELFNEETKRAINMAYMISMCQILNLMYKQSCLCAVEREDLQHELQLLSLILKLQKEFEIFITYRQAQDDKYKETLLKSYLFTFLANDKTPDTVTPVPTNTEKTAKSLSHSKLFRLAKLFGVNRSMLNGQLALISAQQGDVQTAIQYAKETYLDLPDEKTALLLYHTCQALCQYLSTETSYQKMASFCTTVHEDIETMAQRAQCYCHPGMLSKCQVLCSNLSRANDVLRNCENDGYSVISQKVQDNDGMTTKDPCSEWCFEHFFSEEGLVMETSMVMPLAYKQSVITIPFVSPMIIALSQKTLDGRSYSDTITEHFLNQLGQVTDELMQFLSENGHIFIALSYMIEMLRCTIQYGSAVCLNGDTQNQAESESRDVGDLIAQQLQSCKESVIIILQKAMNQHVIDHKFIVGCMTDLDNTTVVGILKKHTAKSGHQYKRAVAIGRIGMDMSRLMNDTKLLDFFKTYMWNAKWDVKLGKLKVQTKSSFSRNNNMKIKLLSQLVSSKYVTVTIIKEFCCDYDIILDDALLLYLEKLLVPSSGDVGSQETTITPSQGMPDKLMLKVSEVLDALNHHDQLCDKMWDILKKIDAYDYEKIAFVLTYLNNTFSSDESKLGLNLIHELENYRRVAPPSQYELSFSLLEEEETHNKHASLLHKDRLPFHPLLYGNAFHILTPELNAETVDMLLPIASLLKLPLTTLYMVTVKNIVTPYLKMRNINTEENAISADVDKTKCKWTLDKHFKEEFFPTVKSLLMKIPHPYYAVCASNWLLKQLPLGAAKIVALETCIEFAKNWVTSCSESNPEESVKAKMKYSDFLSSHKRALIEQTLLQNNLTDKELIDLSNDPTRLICKLYEHSSIQQRFESRVVLHSLPDIHKAAATIAEISSLALSEMKHVLVDKWLPPMHQDNPDITLNMTSLNVDVTLRQEDEQSEDDEINLKRVIYLLQYEKLQDSLTLLYSNYIDDSSKVSNLCRIRAICCVYTLADCATVDSFFCKTVNFKELLQKLIYLVRLEKLHLSLTLESFSNYNKGGLVRSLWLNHSHDKQAIRLASDLCIGYHINDVQLWSKFLQKMLSFKMINNLEHVMVHHLSYNPELWKMSVYHRAWAKLILMPLVSAVLPLTDKLTDGCLKSYQLIHKCPLVHELDLHDLASRFVKVNLPSCALGCLLLVVEKDVQSKNVKQLLEHDDNLQLTLTQLRQWRKENKLLPMMQQVEHAVYNYINSVELYNVIECHGYVEEFISYLISRKDISGLLAFLLKQQRLSEALYLLKLYERQWNTNNSMPQNAANSDIEKIKKYMESYQLNHLVSYLPLDTNDEMEISG